LPGLIAASIWMTLVISRQPLVAKCHFNALIIPAFND
jgi:hypothetical protein